MHLSSAFKTNRPATQINVFGDYIWLQTLFDSPDDIVLTILNKQTMKEVAKSEDGDLAGAAMYHNNTVWLTSFDIQQSYYSQVDPATGIIQKRSTFTDTTYASMVPVLHDDLLWFSASVPDVDEIAFILLDFVDDATSNC